VAGGGGVWPVVKKDSFSGDPNLQLPLSLVVYSLNLMQICCIYWKNLEREMVKKTGTLAQNCQSPDFFEEDDFL
jgi:hypothetical protein